MAKSAAFSSGDAGSIRTTRHTQVEDFCYITDNTYQHGQVLEMEREVLKTLGFNLSTPTAKTFLLRFLKAEQEGNLRELDPHELAKKSRPPCVAYYNFGQCRHG